MESQLLMVAFFQNWVYAQTQLRNYMGARAHTGSVTDGNRAINALAWFIMSERGWEYSAGIGNIFASVSILL
jgi:hypothetical protein